MNNKLIQDIKKIKISSIISQYLSIHKKGQNYFAICPFHNDKHPSLVINDERNIFKCFTCNTSGDAIKFVSLFKNISYSKALFEIANNFKLEYDLNESEIYENPHQINYNLNQDYLNLCQVYLKQPKFNYVLEYLKSRNINDEDIKKFKIGFNPKNNENNIYDILTNQNISSNGNNSSYKRETLIENGLINLTQNGEHIDFFQNRIVFAISNEDNQIVGFSGRTISNETPKYINSAQNLIFNKSQILYNFNNFLKSEHQWSIYIVEGFMDVIALDKAKINNVVATMGTTLSLDHINLLKKYKKIESVILGFDNDEAGKIATIKNGLVVAKHFNTFVVIQNKEDPKDFDEYLNKFGDEQLHKKVNDIVHFSIYYMKHIIDKIENIADFEYQFNSIIVFLKQYGKNIYIKQYLYLFSALKFEIDLKNIKKQIENIFNIKNKKYEFSNRLNPKSDQIIKKTYLDQYEKNYQYYNDRLILACLIDHEIPNLILNNYYIQMDNKLYNVINMLIEFYSSNTNIVSINESNFKIFHEFSTINQYNKDLVILIEQKVKQNSENSSKYNYDKNVLMKQIYESQINKINLFLTNEITKRDKYPIGSIEREESSSLINKYIKIKNELIKNKNSK